MHEAGAVIQAAAQCIQALHPSLLLLPLRGEAADIPLSLAVNVRKRLSSRLRAKRNAPTTYGACIPKMQVRSMHVFRNYDPVYLHILMMDSLTCTRSSVCTTQKQR